MIQSSEITLKVKELFAYSKTFDYLNYESLNTMLLYNFRVLYKS